MRFITLTRVVGAKTSDRKIRVNVEDISSYEDRGVRGKDRSTIVMTSAYKDATLKVRETVEDIDLLIKNDL